MLVHKRCAERHESVSVGKGANPSVEVQFDVAARHPRLVVRPIAALLARNRLQLNAIDRLIDDATAQERIVDAQRAFFVGAENETRTELLVEMAGGQFQILCRTTFHVEIRHTPAFEIFFKARQRMFQKLETRSGIDVFALQSRLDIGVRQCPVVGFLRADGLVVLRNENVALNAARHHDFVGLGMGRNREETKQNRLNQFFHFFCFLISLDI